MKLLPTLLFVATAFTARLVAADLPPPPKEVMHLDHAKVDDAIAKGMSLAQNSSFKISTSRRTGPGVAEVHEHDTDIFYVLEGQATFVTGGQVVEPKASGPAEVRGKEITGGTPRNLVKGDIIVVPSGVAHWFKDVKGSFVYLVIKVTK